MNFNSTSTAGMFQYGNLYVLAFTAKETVHWIPDANYEILSANYSFETFAGVDGTIDVTSGLFHLFTVDYKGLVGATAKYFGYKRFREMYLLKDQAYSFSTSGTENVLLNYTLRPVTSDVSDVGTIKKCDLWKFITQGCEF